MKRRMDTPVDILIEDDRWEAVDLDTLAQDAARRVLDRHGMVPGSYEISLLACDDARIAELNAQFREKPTPTNVLSWPSVELAAEEDGGQPYATEADPEMGDIAIAFDTCAREAAEAGRALADHVYHLLVHGILHLLGYDHIRDQDAALMEALEVAILAENGIADPYVFDDTDPMPHDGL